MTNAASLRSDATHWIDSQRLPLISVDQSIADAFSHMNAAHVDGAVICVGTDPRWYVSGDRLKDAFNRLRETVPKGAGLADRPLSALISVPDARSWLIEVGSPVPAETPPASLEMGEDGVIPVEDGAGHRVGWFLSPGLIEESFLRPPPVFLCENGHENPQPEGYCQWCPAPIVR
jgi:hypothetical protein